MNGGRSDAPCQGVLLIEDDTDLADAEAQLLRDEGYTVTAASNGQEALALLRSPSTQRPCMILLDMMMPVMDGWEFRAHQVRDPRLAGIPVVIVTADGAAADKGPLLGAAAALIKPVTATQLLAAVKGFCRAS